MKMEPIESSETSDFKTQAPWNNPKENILHKEHGESLKSSNIYLLMKSLPEKNKTFSIITKAHVLTHCEDCFTQCHSCDPPDVGTVTPYTVFLKHGHQCVIC